MRELVAPEKASPSIEYRCLALVHFLLFCFLIAYISFPVVMPLCGGVAVVMLFRRYSTWAIAALNVVVGALVFSSSSYFFVAGIDALSLSGSKILAYLGVLLFFYLYLHATASLPRNIAVFSLIVIVSLVASLYSSRLVHFGPVALCLIASVWHNCFYVLSIESRSQIRVLDFLVNQMPFFSFNPLPIPPLLSQALRSDLEQGDILASQRGAIKLLLVVAGCVLVKEKVFDLSSKWVIFRAILSPDDLYLAGINIHKHFEFSIMERWFIAIGSIALFILKVMISQGPAVAACRMMGIGLKSPVYDLFGARTLYQLFERYNHYYCLTLLNIFIYPLYRTFTFLRSPPTRTALSFFIGIVSFGFVSHFLRLVLRSASTAQEDIFFKFAPNVFYWIVVAGATIASIALERKSSRKGTAPGYLAIRWTLYVLITSVSFVFVMDYESGGFTWSEKIAFLLGMFGVTHSP